MQWMILMNRRVGSVLHERKIADWEVILCQTQVKTRKRFLTQILFYFSLRLDFVSCTITCVGGGAGASVGASRLGSPGSKTIFLFIPTLSVNLLWTTLV